MIRITDEQGRWLRESLEVVRSSNPNSAIISELILSIDHQLAGTNHFDDLIDTIVKVVSEPRITTLGREALSLLRKGILSPIELSRFNVQVSRGQECNRCGMELGSYETVTLRDRQIFCHQCAHPEVITCQTCHVRLDASGLQTSIQRLFQRHKCPGSPAVPPEGHPMSDVGSPAIIPSRTRGPGIARMAATTRAPTMPIGLSGWTVISDSPAPSWIEESLPSTFTEDND